jgi:hypothetical protein
MARIAIIAAAAAGLLFGAATVAPAQINGASPRDPKACAPGAGSDLKTPDTPTPQSPDATTGSGNLSDKLARSNGVLCPPNVDPGIKAPTPETGKMPVIPPPGSPGGNPDVHPK